MTSKRILFACGVIALLIALPIILTPIFHDASIYLYGAQRIVGGGLPYVDIYDIKAPGIFFQFAVELLVGRSFHALFIFDILWMIGAAFWLRSAIARIAGEFAGLTAGVTLIFGYITLMYSYHFLQPETCAAFFVAWLLDIALRSAAPTKRDGLEAGFALAILFWLKPPFILFGPLALPRLWRNKQSAVPAIAWSLAVFTGVGLAVFGHFAIRGGNSALIEGAFKFPAQVTRELAYPIADRFAHLEKGIFGISKQMWSVAILAVIGMTYAIGKKQRNALTLFAMLLFAIAVIFIQGRFLFYHFDVILLPMAAFAGVAMSKAIGDDPKNQPVIALALAVFLLIPAFKNINVLWPKLIAARGNVDRYLDTVPSFYATKDEALSIQSVLSLQRKLGEETKEGDTIFPFNLDPSFNVYSGRLSPTRFAYLWPLTDDRLSPASHRQELENDVMKARPKYIVLSRINTRDYSDDLQLLQSWPNLGAWFEENYELEDIVGPLQTYRLKGTKP